MESQDFESRRLPVVRRIEARFLALVEPLQWKKIAGRMSSLHQEESWSAEHRCSRHWDSHNRFHKISSAHRNQTRLSAMG